MVAQNPFLFDSTNIQIKSLNINTEESEFSPFKIGSSFYFTSSKERKVGAVHLDEATGHQMLDLYLGELRDSITIKGVNALSEKINNSLNQGSCFYDVASSRLYYAGDVATENFYKKYKLAIFSSEFKNNEFLDPKIELVLGDTFSVAHPMLHNGKLYFSSNLPGGKGKTDIYYAEKMENEWVNITNLKNINTSENEYFPYAVNEKEIYFSSNRPGGYGKVDIYKYTLIDSTYLIQNLGSPINSKSDDFGIYMDPLQEQGYFASNRKRGQDDIYYFSQIWPTFKNCSLPVFEDYCYNLTEESSLDSDSLKSYYYQWSFGDGSREKGLSVRHCFPGPGNYLINLNIIDSITKAVFMNQAVFDLKVDSVIQLKINCLDTVLQNRTFNINTDWTYLPNNQIMDYYFEVDGARLKGKAHNIIFKDVGVHKIQLGVTTINKKTNQKELLCTTKDLICVEPKKWLAIEKRKISNVINNLARKSFTADSSFLFKIDDRQEVLKFNNQGLNGILVVQKMQELIEAKKVLPNADISQILSKLSESNLIMNSTNAGYKLPVMDTLLDIKESSDISFKVHLGISNTYKDTAVLSNKGINGADVKLIDNQYHYTYGNEKTLKNIENYYNESVKAGIENATVIAYKNDSIIPAQIPYLKTAEFDKVKATEDSVKINNIIASKNNLEITKQVNENSNLSGTNDIKNLSNHTGAEINKNATTNITKNALNTSEFEEYGSLRLTEAQKTNLTYLKDFGSVKVDGLEFKVQIGVYKKRTNYTFPHLNGLGQITSETLKDGSQRITIGASYKTLREAINYNKKIIQSGQEDAFVSVYYNGTRIGIENLVRQGVLVKTQVITDSISKTKITINNSNLLEYNETITPENDSEKNSNSATSNLEAISKNTNSSKLNETSGNSAFIATTNIQKKAIYYAEKYGNIAAMGLEFKVQIAIFKYKSNYAFPKLERLGKIEKEKTRDGATCLTIGGSFATLNEAIEYNKQVVQAGQADAFVSVYYYGNRVYYENLEKRGIFKAQ